MEPTLTADLLIPAKNEAENLDALAAALRPLLEAGALRRVVLVDNGSTDATAELARGHGFTVVPESRPGYGSACLAGLNHICEDPPDAVGFFDADLADDPEHLPRLIEELASGRADLALGARNAQAERGALDPHQRFGNALACLLMRLATGRRYRDMGPMRVVRWESLQRLAMADTTWGWTLEMQHKAVTRGLRVVELDVPYRRRHAGKSKITGSLTTSFRVGVKILFTVAKLWATERREAPEQVSEQVISPAS